MILLFYIYFGYGILIYLVDRNKEQTKPSLVTYPTVSIVTPVFNEADILAEKIENTLAIGYPADKLSIIFISDGSTDRTTDILKKYNNRITFIQKDKREGKASAINTAMQTVQSDLVVFTDANGMLNPDCLTYILPHFSNPAIGAVAGEKKISAAAGLGQAEGLYWKYESLLKKLDARYYTVLSATGELMALRTNLFTPLDDDTILDDFSLSLSVCLQGYIIGYEARAYSTEASTSDLNDEKGRKVRIAAGAHQILATIPWKRVLANKQLAFQFISRRWLRWIASPVLLVLLFIFNLLIYRQGYFYSLSLLLQLIFYGVAIIGFLLARSNKKMLLATLPFYFLFMNYCLVAGWVRYRQKKQGVLWQKAKRKV